MPNRSYPVQPGTGRHLDVPPARVEQRPRPRASNTPVCSCRRVVVPRIATAECCPVSNAMRCARIKNQSGLYTEHRTTPACPVCSDEANLIFTKSDPQDERPTRNDVMLRSIVRRVRRF